MIYDGAMTQQLSNPCKEEKSQRDILFDSPSVTVSRAVIMLEIFIFATNVHLPTHNQPNCVLCVFGSPWFVTVCFPFFAKYMK